MELEQAYRILELKPGAGVKEAVEAREDQLALWDPDRLAHHPRLRSRAPARIERIREAYELVMRHLDESGGPRPIHGDTAASGSVAAGSATTAASSIFEEVFSPASRPHRTPGPVAIVLVSAAILTLGWAALRFLDSPVESTPEELTDRPASPQPEPGGPPSGETDSGEAENSPAVAESGRAAASVSGPGRFEAPASRLPPPRRDGPKLVRRPADSKGGAAPPEALREGEWVYRRLLAGSPIARKLVEGSLPGWRIQSWELVQAKPPEYWIDLTGVREDGSTAHLVWSVNLQSGAVEPWNEGARALEAATP